MKLPRFFGWILVLSLLAPLEGIEVGESFRVGLFDLSDRDFEERGIAELNGDWLIYWQQLLTPSDLSAVDLIGLAAGADGVFSFPGTWNNWEYRGENVGGTGYATFVADVLLPVDMTHGALWIPNASTAYRLWVDDELVAESGTPGTDRRESRPHYVMNTAQFPVSDSGRARFVLQVSNYHHRRGGMWKPIKLGTPSQVALLDVHETTYDLLLLGSFVALGLFNFFLYWTNRDTTGKTNRGIAVPVLLSIAFLALIIRVMVTGQILTTRLIPGFPWGLQLRLEYLSAMVVLISFAWISERAYPGVVPRRVIWFITGFVGVNAAIALFFPVMTYSRVVTSYNIIKSITLLGMTIRFFVWALKGHKDALAMVGAIMIFFLITLGETLHYREIILSRDFAPVGFLVSIFGSSGTNQTLIYLVSTVATLVVMLVVFNLFVLKVSLTFLRSESKLTPLDFGSLSSRYGITGREEEILQLVAVGKSNKEIAAELFISEGTVKNHLYRIMRKLDVGNRTEIAVRLTTVPIVSQIPLQHPK